MEAQVTKLVEARSKAELNVNEVYRGIDEAIVGAARKARVETIVGKAKDFLSTAISKNDQLIKLAARHPNKAQITVDLELWLKEASETHDKYVIRARQYIASLTEPQSTSKTQRKASSRGKKTNSMALSHKRLIAKLKREEVERENENKLKLAQQKHQLELNTISEENGNRLFEAKVNELEAMETSDESLGNEFDDQLTSNHIDTVERVTDWVNNAKPNNTFPAAIETMPSEEPRNLGAANPGIAAPQMEINPLLGRSRDHVPVESLQHNDVQIGPSLTEITQVPQALLGGFHDQSLFANTKSSFTRTPRGITYFLSLGNNDAQQPDDNLQTDSQNIQVAVNLSDNGVRPNHPSSQGEALNLTSNDANHNNSEQQQTEAANVNNSMMLSTHTNLPIFVNQSTNNQNVVANTNNTNVVLSQPFNTQNQNAHVQSRHNPLPNHRQNYYPMASHLLPNLTLWHMPTLDSVAQSVSQVNAQQMTNSSMSQPVVSFSSGGTTFYHQNPFSTATVVNQPIKPVSAPLQQPAAPTPLYHQPTMPIYPSSALTPLHAAQIPQTNQSFNVKDLADAITSSHLNPLPKWNLANYNGDTLLWHEWIGQFRSAKDSQNLSDAAKLTYLKGLLTGKAKKSIDQFAYSVALYNDAMKVLERKFGQPHAIVGAHLDKLNNYPPLKMHNSENIIAYASVISSLVGVFRSLSYEADLQSSSLVNQAVDKLPPNLKESWCSHIVRNQWDRPTLLDFNDWLQTKSDTHDRMKTAKFKTKPEELPFSSKSKTTSNVFASSSKITDAKTKTQTPRPIKDEPCPHCKANHPLWRCPKFTSENPTQRTRIVAENRLCFSCLKGSHQFRSCPNPRKCNHSGCTSSHNSLLHGADRIFPRNNPKKGSKANNTPPTQSSSSVTVGGKNELPTQSSSSSFPSVSDVKGHLQVKQVELISPTDEKTKVFALCDPACSHSWISNAAAERLKLKGKSLRLTVCGINTQQTIDTLVTDVTVKPIAENTCESFHVSPYIRENLNIGSDIVDVPHLRETYPYLSVLDPVRYSYSNIEMILGQDVYHAIRPIEYFESEPKCAPVAVRLPIGWVLSGPLPSSSTFVSSCFKAIIEPEQDLVEQLRTWYELESYGAMKEVDPRSSADRRAVEILEKTTKHDGQRYQVGMLWANDDLDLPNNYYSALVQLKSLEKRLSKDEELRSKYSKNINDDFEKGYVFRVENPKDPSQRSKREWYLPHHPVINPNKPGKIRRVLNGAAKFHGTSLNRSLLTGPDLLQRLIHTLIRFRQHKYAVSADIEGMFLQVGVPLADQPCLRFLWREDPSSEVMVYQYSRHIFGAKDSPTCANFALQKTAKDNIRKFPDAAQAVLDKFYMDDYLDSLETPHEALSRAKKLVELLKLGGFKLTKFISNTPHLLDEIENNDQLSQPKVILVSDEEASSQLLGLKCSGSLKGYLSH